MLALPNGPTNAPGPGKEMTSLDRTEGTQLILHPHAELA